MRCELTIRFDAGRELDIAVQAEPAPEQGAAARAWLDETWGRLGCEPVRPSGKVLLADKVLGIAGAYGYDKLKADPALAREFAQQVALALGRPRVSVDVAGLVVAY